MPWPVVTMNDSRKEFVRRAQRSNDGFAALCREFGISRKTGYKWVRRSREAGSSRWQDRSRRPHSCPSRLGEDVVCALGKLKLAHERWGPAKIRELYRRVHGQAPSVSACHRVLQKLGLVQPRRRRVRPGRSRLHGPTPALRPNHVWTVDFKGWWRLASGERCEPLTVCDAYSRYVLATVIPTNTGAEAVHRVFVELFEQYGLPEVIHSDNGSPFACVQAPLGLSRLSAWWVSLGIEVVHSRPGHPEDNPSHERMHGDIEAAFARRGSPDAPGQQAGFDLWRQEYNTVRPNEALGQRCPAELYHRSDRPYREAEPDYGPEFIRRRVSKIGRVSCRGHLVFVSATLAGHWLGLRRRPGQQYEVWLHHLLLGHIELQTFAFRVAPSGDTERERLSA